MHCTAGMPKGGLGKPLRIPGTLGPLRRCVTVAVKTDPFNCHTSATASKLGAAVAVRGRVSPGKCEVENRLLVSLVLRMEQFQRRVLMLGAKAALLAGVVVLPVENSALALEHSES